MRRCTYRLMSEGRFFHTYNVVTIVTWAGVGKSTLVNHWLRRMAAEQYCSAQLVFGWSFYRQGTSGGTSSEMNFLMRLSPGLAIQIHGSERHGSAICTMGLRYDLVD